MLVFAYIIGPHLFRPRAVVTSPMTNWVANLSVAASLGLLLWSGLSVVPAGILQVLIAAQIGFAALGLRNRFQGVNRVHMHRFFAQKTFERHVTAILFVFFLLGDVTVFLPLLIKYLFDDNYRAVAKDVGGGLFWSMIWSARDIVMPLWRQGVQRNAFRVAGLISLAAGTYVNSLFLFILGLGIIAGVELVYVGLRNGWGHQKEARKKLFDLLMIRDADKEYTQQKALHEYRVDELRAKFKEYGINASDRFLEFLMKEENRGNIYTFTEDQIIDMLGMQEKTVSKAAARKMLQKIVHWPVMRIINGGF